MSPREHRAAAQKELTERPNQELALRRAELHALLAIEGQLALIADRLQRVGN